MILTASAGPRRNGDPASGWPRGGGELPAGPCAPLPEMKTSRRRASAVRSRQADSRSCAARSVAPARRPGRSGPPVHRLWIHRRPAGSRRIVTRPYSAIRPPCADEGGSRRIGSPATQAQYIRLIQVVGCFMVTPLSLPEMLPFVNTPGPRGVSGPVRHPPCAGRHAFSSAGGRSSWRPAVPRHPLAGPERP